MSFLVIISLVLLAGYTVGACIVSGGVPESVSATFYTVRRKRWFTACMGGAAMTLLPVLLEITPQQWQWLCFLTACGLLMCAAAPHFRDDATERGVHTTGALLVLLCPVAWALAMRPAVLVLWTAWAAWCAYNRLRRGSFDAANPLFWAEVTTAAVIYSAIISN